MSATAPGGRSGGGRLAREALTHPGLIRLDYYPPPPALAPFVTTFYYFRCDEPLIRDTQPAAIGNLSVFMRGHGTMRFRDGRAEQSHLLTFATPCTAAAPFEVEGPWRCFGAALSPLGWAALTGLSAAEHANRLCDGEALLGPAFGDAARRIAAAYNGAGIEPAEMGEILGTAIGAALRPVRPAHARLIGTVIEWLAASPAPELAVLERKSGYSSRQLQRLVERYFGLPPRGLARQYRALRAAALLASPATSSAEAAAAADHFYDQSHMIREIRLFAGRTPARLGDDESPVLNALLDLRNFREIDGAASPP